MGYRIYSGDLYVLEQLQEKLQVGVGIGAVRTPAVCWGAWVITVVEEVR